MWAWINSDYEVDDVDAMIELKRAEDDRRQDPNPGTGLQGSEVVEEMILRLVVFSVKAPLRMESFIWLIYCRGHSIMVVNHMEAPQTRALCLLPSLHMLHHPESTAHYHYHHPAPSATLPSSPSSLAHLFPSHQSSPQA